MKQEYRLHVNPRARNINLRVTPEEGLVVSVPQRCSQREVAAVLAEKSSWIERSLAWAEEQRRLAADIPPLVIPSYIDLPGVGESWQLESNRTEGQRARVREQGFRRLRVTGDIFRTSAVAAGLQRWLARRARCTLVPRLDELAARHGFAPVKKTEVRNQKSCWASCSPTGTISINRKLLFLPREQMEYILIHELCHTVHLDHSKRFWRLVASIQPCFREIERSLSVNGDYIPRWALAGE